MVLVFSGLRIKELVDIEHTRVFRSGHRRGDSVRDSDIAALAPGSERGSPSRGRSASALIACQLTKALASAVRRGLTAPWSQPPSSAVRNHFPPRRVAAKATLRSVVIDVDRCYQQESEEQPSVWARLIYRPVSSHTSPWRTESTSASFAKESRTGTPGDRGALGSDRTCATPTSATLSFRRNIRSADLAVLTSATPTSVALASQPTSLTRTSAAPIFVRRSCRTLSC